MIILGETHDRYTFIYHFSFTLLFLLFSRYKENDGCRLIDNINIVNFKSVTPAKRKYDKIIFDLSHSYETLHLIVSRFSRTNHCK